MRVFKEIIKPAIICILSLTIICGGIYPLAVTLIGQVAFNKQVNGSAIEVTLKNGEKKVFGSKLIAQKFTDKKYLIGRPMKVSNLSPTSKELKKIIAEREKWWHSFEQNNSKRIPIDLLTASGSGVDPNISLAAAEYQVPRIAMTRKISENSVRDIINKYKTKKFLFIFGDEGVNVLEVNLALDGLL